MSASVKPSLSATTTRHGLGVRMAIVATILAVETLLLSYVIQGTPLSAATGIAAAVHDVQHWLFRFAIAYSVCCFLLFSLSRSGSLMSIGARFAGARYRGGPFLLHVTALTMLAVLSANLYDPALRGSFIALAVSWHLTALGLGISLFAAAAPLRVWADALRNHGRILLFAIAPALGTVLAIRVSQSLWHPAAELTFRMTVGFLSPFVPTIYSNYSTLTLGTQRFAVVIADECSGLEGMGLMAIFCISWLWFFRREFKFPQALLIVPIALVLMFFLNILRISALLLIGDAGYRQIAVVGFHSQAGWIAFNSAAIAVAILAKRTPWFVRGGPVVNSLAPTRNPTAAFLMPLLSILATGMVVRAMSAGFDFLYPVQVLVCGFFIWFYRAEYVGVNRRFGLQAVGAGALVFAFWIGWDHWFNVPRDAPQPLTEISATIRNTWIIFRALGAIVTVPLAEELAYRGYLMRRLQGEDFETIAYQAVGWPAIVISSLIFGVAHGSMWLPGVGAGLVFGALARRTGRIGDAIAAHAVANAGIAVYVLTADQWQLW